MKRCCVALRRDRGDRGIGAGTRCSTLGRQRRCRAPTRGVRPRDVADIAARDARRRLFTVMAVRLGARFLADRPR